MHQTQAGPRFQSLRDLSQDREGQGETGSRARKKRALLLLLGLALILAALAGISIWLWPGGGLKVLFPAAVAGKVEAEAEPRYLTNLREFQVNLADSGARRYLRVRIVLGSDDKAVQSELSRRESEMRSAIIILLRGKTVAELAEPGGMQALQEELLADLNRRLASGKLKAVYFVDFIIQ